MIRVALADDETLVRRGIRGLLELTGRFQIVGEAADGDAAMDLVSTCSPDVLLMDIRMPKRSGIEVLIALRQESPHPPPTILLTTFDDDEALLQGIRHGAKGFLLKDVDVDILAHAIDIVAAGGNMIRPAISDKVLRTLEGQRVPFEAAHLPEALTPRELDVLRLMAAGWSNREIAEGLHAAEGTIKNHCSSVLSKLGVRDRTRAVLRALELGIL
ncbi:MAG: response regulator transcription factor [Bryobacterales bacterium]|jgi:DNA-binding NarL/FixJ family response regulator|nr:response regulator transcription factor [Bryobacterales bacterium]